MDMKSAASKKNRKGDDCKYGGSSIVTISFCVLCAVTTCYFVYRVTVLESRVDYLEKEFQKLISLSQDVESFRRPDDAEKDLGTPTRRRRNTAECVCPPGESIFQFSIQLRVVSGCQ